MAYKDFEDVVVRNQTHAYVVMLDGKPVALARCWDDAEHLSRALLCERGEGESAWWRGGLDMVGDRVMRCGGWRMPKCGALIRLYNDYVCEHPMPGELVGGFLWRCVLCGGTVMGAKCNSEGPT
jgi:hypothetical protein